MQTLNFEDIKKILARRDHRYDGRFFFGVRTTKIYCRPICPARPKPENIIVFRSPSEAEKSGYRPCLRCRPDHAPHSQLLQGTANTVSRALRIIQESSDPDLNIEQLATSLGVSDRHLRRLFDEHLGASPIEIMNTKRLHFARQTLQQTSLPISEIAFAAGFRSIRRFNEAFKTSFRSTPTEFRGAVADRVVEATALRIPVHLPYDWQNTLAYLKRHETFGVEFVCNNSYRRYISHPKGVGSITVTFSQKEKSLLVNFHAIPITEMRAIMVRVKKLFDTEHHPLEIPTSARPLPAGVRVPAAFHPFEVAISIILGQLVSTEQAKVRVQKLVEHFGRKIVRLDDQMIYQFPTPQTLADARIEEIGLSRVMGHAIRELSRAVISHDIDFSAHMSFDDLNARLLRIKGIGKWTASLILMRCCSNPDAFPDTDLVIKRVLDTGTVDIEPWISQRAYLTHCLWRDSFKRKTKENV